jgi:hypothetical protein
MLDTTSGVLQSATGTLKNAWSGTGPQFSQHIADISKGVLIIVIGGLAAGVILSLVSVAGACSNAASASDRCRSSRPLCTTHAGRHQVQHRLQPAFGNEKQVS